MIVKRIVRKVDGNLEATLMLTGEQAAFLMNTGLGFLVQRGAATLMDLTPEEYEEERQKSLQEKAAMEAKAEQANTPEPTPTPAEPQPTTVTPIGPTKEEMKTFLENVDIEILHKA